MQTESAARAGWARARGFQARLERFLDTAPEGTLVVDEAGCIRLANTQVAEIFGYTPAELIGLSVEELLPASERERHQEARASFSRAPRDRPMGRGPMILAQRRDGSRFHVDIELRPRATPDGLMTLAVVHDRGGVEPGEAQYLAREAQRRLTLVRLAAEDLAELVAGLMSVLEGASGTEVSSPHWVTRLEEAHSTAFLVHEIAQQLVSYGSEELSLPASPTEPTKR